MPYPGYIQTIILETPFDFSKIPNFDKNREYVAFTSSLLEVVFQKKKKFQEKKNLKKWCLIVNFIMIKSLGMLEK